MVASPGCRIKKMSSKALSPTESSLPRGSGGELPLLHIVPLRLLPGLARPASMQASCRHHVVYPPAPAKRGKHGPTEPSSLGFSNLPLPQEHLVTAPSCRQACNQACATTPIRSVPGLDRVNTIDQGPEGGRKVGLGPAKVPSPPRALSATAKATGPCSRRPVEFKR